MERERGEAVTVSTMATPIRRRGAGTIGWAPRNLDLRDRGARAVGEEEWGG
jgi:hypothetical protein